MTKPSLYPEPCPKCPFRPGQTIDFGTSYAGLTFQRVEHPPSSTGRYRYEARYSCDACGLEWVNIGMTGCMGRSSWLLPPWPKQPMALRPAAFRPWWRQIFARSR